MASEGGCMVDDFLGFLGLNQWEEKGIRKWNVLARQGLPQDPHLREKKRKAD